MKDNSDFKKEFITALNDPSQSRKDLGKSIGLPDKVDEDFLQKLVAQYELQNPGWLKFMRDEARKAFEAGRYGSVFNDDGTVNKGSHMAYDFELPVSFHRLVEKYYPLMFRDVHHYRWFKRTFAALMIRPNSKRFDKKPGTKS